MFLAND